MSDKQPNRTESSVGHANAFTNNTFSLVETQKAIRDTIDSSFHYLEQLQKDYISISRFNKTEEDLYLDYVNKLCLIVDKDIIEPTKRRAYRSSEFYNELISLDDMNTHPKIFTYIPMVLMDGELVTSFQIKSNLDGNTEFIFNHIGMPLTYLKSAHSVEVVFLKHATFYTFITNFNQLDRYDWNLPISIHGIEEMTNTFCFLSVKDSTAGTGSNVFPASFDENGNLFIDQNNLTIYDTVTQGRDIEFTIFKMEDMYQVEGYRPVRRRIDNNRLSTTIVLQPAEQETYPMPIHPHNLFILRRNKVTGEIAYENNKDVILHYPNFYEIMSDELTEEYEYQIYYFFRYIKGYPAYVNHLAYIYRYITKKLDCTIEEAINKMLYEGINDTAIAAYFYKIFDYDEKEYAYSHGDFFGSMSPFDFDYKIAKLKEMIQQDPDVLRKYGEKVATPFDTYFLNVKGVDLQKRLRYDTSNETDDPEQQVTFPSAMYVFTFRNETTDYLDLRFFIDGILCTTYHQLHTKDIEYFYLPVSLVKRDSYVEVEDFHSYNYIKEVRFTSTSVPIDIDFPESYPFKIQPTLYDLFITTEKRTKLDRSKFKLYFKLDTDNYDISDILEDPSAGDDGMISTITLNDKVEVDPITGTVYVTLDDHFLDDVNMELDDTYQETSSSISDRLPLKHALLNSIRIYCTDSELINQKLLVLVNKTSYLAHKTMTNPGLLNVRLFNGRLAWAEKDSFVRTFVNGRFSPLEFELTTDSSGASIFVSKSFMNAGDTITVDISPFSYDLEYHLETIPDDFIVSFDGGLSKPFSFIYYDIYLNGRKLNENNIEVLSANKIKLFNVQSRKNLYIYRRDRDYEYYGVSSVLNTPLDDFLNSDILPDRDKTAIIDQIVHESHSDITIAPGSNTEPDIELSHGTSITPEAFDLYRFYVDIILPRGVVQANSFFVDSEVLEDYGTVQSRYQTGNRLVLSANKNPETSSVVFIGKRSS